MIHRHSGESSAILPVGVVTQTTCAPACTSERYRSWLRRSASSCLRRSVMSAAISTTPVISPSPSCEGNHENDQCRTCSPTGHRPVLGEHRLVRIQHPARRGLGAAARSSGHTCDGIRPM